MMSYMANTYSKIYLHLIFAVKNRDALLGRGWRQEVFKYIFNAINKRGNYCYAVNGTYDHMHIFFDYKCKELIPDLVREIKKSSTSMIRQRSFSRYQFNWQAGYGIFSHGYAEKSKIIDYINSQESHHSKQSFKEEYISFLSNYKIEYERPYLFDFL